MGSNVPKQYLMLGGMPILVHTLKAFQRTAAVDDVILVLPEEDLKTEREGIVERYQLSKVRRIVPGGKYRQDSVMSGLEAVDARYDIVVIHDGVRPFVSPLLIEIAIKETFETGAVAVGVPAKDTLKMVDSSGFVMDTLIREQVWLTQTPQVFKTALIKEAYKRAYDDHYYGTDDAALVERMGAKVRMVTGSYDNIKITTKSDLTLGEFILTTRHNGSVESDFDAEIRYKT